MAVYVEVLHNDIRTYSFFQIHMSAISSLQTEVDSLTTALREVTAERDSLLKDRDSPPSSLSEMQSQRYEDRIVELHSVIAELSRKLDDEREDRIREESEWEEGAEEAEGRAVCDEEEEDYTSLAFERAIDKHTASLRRLRTTAEGNTGESTPSSCEETEELKREVERWRLEAEEAKTRAERMEAEAKSQRIATEAIVAERDSLRRQVEDIKTTVEYQEVKMEGSAASSATRNSSERRSLRRRRNRDQAGVLSRGDSAPPLPQNTSSSSRESATPDPKVMKIFKESFSLCLSSSLTVFLLLFLLLSRSSPLLSI